LLSLGGVGYICIYVIDRCNVVEKKGLRVRVTFRFLLAEEIR